MFLRKRDLEKPESRWKDDIKMDVKDVVLDSLDLNQLAEDRIK
jgi:hypothetical protein